MKTILRFFAMAALALPSLTVATFYHQDIAQAVEATAATTVYFEPNSSWESSSDHYAAYFFAEGKEVVWKAMSSVSADRYSVDVPAGYPNVIFCGMKAGANDWDNVAYQTKDLLISEDGKDVYTLFPASGNRNKGLGFWNKDGETLSVDGGQNGVKNTKYGTYYQMLVYSFADGDGDGIGDFKGISDHLDYLQRLGIAGLWLSPVAQSDAYHGYSITDYYSVNTDYVVTVNEITYDLNKLVEECHARGIKVIVDTVLNHCSYNHPWNSTHPDWFTNDPAFDGMRDFNLEKSAVVQELYNIAKWWLQEFGIDGFRLDAVKWFYNQNGMDYADDARNVQFLNGLYEACKTIKPDVYMVGENFTSDGDEIMYYHSSGIDALFDFPAMWSLPNWAKGNAKDYTNYLSYWQNGLRNNNPDAIEASFLSNHDAGRYGSGLTLDQYLFAGYMNVLSPGNSYVYYGDELGLTGNVNFDNTQHSSGYEDIVLRTPMPFASGKTDLVSYLKGFSSPYRPVLGGDSATFSGLNANQEESGNNTIYRGYAQAIRAKNAVPLLYHGAISPNNIADDATVGSFISRSSTSSATVIFNASPDRKQLAFHSAPTVLANVGTNGAPIVQDNVLTMSPYSVAIIDGSKSFSTYVDGEPVIIPDDPSGPTDPDNPDTPSTAYEGLYLRGEVNGWEAQPSYALVPSEGKYAYELKGVYLTAGQDFKFGNADWTKSLGFYDRTREANEGDFTECFELGGDAENGNIRPKAGYTGHYDFFITKANKIVAYKASTCEYRTNADNYAASKGTVKVVNPWYTYRVTGLALTPETSIKLLCSEVDTDYRPWILASEVKADDGFPAEKLSDGTARVLITGTYDLNVTITGYDSSWNLLARYVFTCTSSTVLTEASAFASSFNTALGAACSIDGNSDRVTVASAWAGQAEAFAALSEDAKLVLKKATASSADDDLAAFAAKYDAIYIRRGVMWELTDFADRTPAPQAAYRTSSLSFHPSYAAIFVLLGTASILGVGLFLAKKKKVRK